MRMVDRVMRGMMTGASLDMARACYAYSRAHGVPVWDSFVGAWQLFWIYRKDQTL